MTGKFEQDATAKLQASMSCLIVGGCVANLKDKVRTSAAATDLVEKMQGVCGVILAAESLKEAADMLADKARAALRDAMVDTGCPSVETATHTVGLQRGAVSARIVDRTLIPERFLTPQPAKIELAEISKALKAGLSIPGAVLSNGGAPVIAFRARKVKPAPMPEETDEDRAATRDRDRASIDEVIAICAATQQQHEGITP